jgi:hypothetical protein
MLIFDYPSKKDLKAAVGKPLKYRETSAFGPEYDPNGDLTGSNRPTLTGHRYEFFARVSMEDGLIKNVS